MNKNHKKQNINKTLTCNNAPVPSSKRKHIPYSEEIIEEFLFRIEEGESMRSICNDSHMPNRSTICRWLNDPTRHSLRDSYLISRVVQAELFVDQLKDLEQDLRNGKIDAQQCRVMSDNIKWVACKLHPRSFGDKIDVTSSDGSITPPIVKVMFIDKTSNKEEQNNES